MQPLLAIIKRWNLRSKNRQSFHSQSNLQNFSDTEEMFASLVVALFETVSFVLGQGRIQPVTSAKGGFNNFWQ